MLSRNSSGFTLLEVMIAMSIMLIAFTAILTIESSALKLSQKSRDAQVVAMLAKDAMIDAEMITQNKPFNDIKKEDHGVFKEPFQDYSWKREILEVQFPDLFQVGNANQSAQGGSNQTTGTQTAEMIGKVITKFLSKALREIKITIEWKRGKGTATFTVSQYWVNLNQEFVLSE